MKCIGRVGRVALADTVQVKADRGEMKDGKASIKELQNETAKKAEKEAK